MPINSYSKFYQNIDFHLHREKITISEHAALYLTNTIRVLAVSLVGIFLPIYIFGISENFLLFNQNIIINGISWVLSYFLLRSAFCIISLLLLGNLIFSRIHFQLSMIISFVILIVEILMWHLAQDNLVFILVAGILAGIKVTMYWIPYHIFFIRKSGKAKKGFGKNTGMRFFLTRVISGIGPAIGGLIILNFGFNVLFMVSILLLVVAALPIVFVIHEWKHKEHNMVDVIRDFVINKDYKKVTLSYIGQGIDSSIYTAIWPIMLFFVLNNFAKIGFINSFSYVMSSLVVLWIGRIIDKRGTYKIHALGVILNSILYIPRMFFSIPWLFYSLDVGDRFISGMYSLPMMSASYQKARKLGDSDFQLYRQLMLHLGIVLILVLILVMLQILMTWKWVFVLAIIGSLMTFLIELDDH